jgi:hypothetical protein
MADIEVKRSVRPARSNRRTLLNARQKCRLYEMVYDLNRGFALTLEVFDRMERAGFFRRDYLRAFHSMTDEIRARANHELTETLRDREQRETAQYGRVRQKWERRFKDAGDRAFLTQRHKKALR